MHKSEKEQENGQDITMIKTIYIHSTSEEDDKIGGLTDQNFQSVIKSIKSIEI